MISAEIKKSISKSVLCWLATSSKDNIPNVSPKEVFTYYENSRLIIGCIASPQSMRNIKVNPNVCVSFIDVFVQKGFQMKGTADLIFKKHPSYPQMLAELVRIAGDKIPIPTIIDIHVASVKPIVAPSYTLFPEISEEEQASNAMRIYGVRPWIK